MRILTLTHEYPPLGGGGGVVARQFAREMVRLGHEVDLVTGWFEGLAEEEVDGGVRVLRIPFFRRHKDSCGAHEHAAFLWRCRPVARALATAKSYDVAHTHFILPGGALGAALLRSHGVPYIITVHGSDVPGYNPHKFKVMHRLAAPWWRHAAVHSYQIVCASTYMHGLFEAAWPRSGCSLGLIPFGFDLTGLSPAHKSKTILMVSRLQKRKGFQHVLEALEGIDDDWEVHVVGDGPMRPELEALASRLIIPVKFWGWLGNSSQELRDLYAHAAISVLPSFVESFGVVLIEAMAAGAAVITSNTTACPEVVGDAGLLVEPGNVEQIRAALLRLMGDAQYRQELGARGRKRVEEHFGWERVGEAYSTLLAEAASEGRKGGGR